MLSTAVDGDGLDFVNFAHVAEFDSNIIGESLGDGSKGRMTKNGRRAKFSILDRGIVQARAARICGRESYVTTLCADTSA
jgi:hypothetical protein